MAVPRWEIQKNRIDMDYQEALQKYQVVVGAVYALPITTLGIFLQTGFTTNNFFFAGFIAYLVFGFFKEKESKIKQELEHYKKQVSSIRTSTG